jgi:carbohydrate-selective porin OprB
MDSPERTNVRRRVRRSIAAAAVAALAAASAGASAQSSSPFAGFLLERGRYTTIDSRNPRLQVVPAGINEQGEIVGEVKSQLREGAQHDLTRGNKRLCSRAPARRACRIPMSGAG